MNQPFAPVKVVAEPLPSIAVSSGPLWSTCRGIEWTREGDGGSSVRSSSCTHGHANSWLNAAKY
ncbi:hypothetical protein C2E23DRAFT_816103 [Lenzites betulinus]|nr:hypothetical protein C2E23DRAFT_816103 [Lenzites betulinus]